MTLLLGLTALLCLLTLYLVLATLRQLRRGRLLRAGSNVMLALVAATLGTLGVVIATSYLGYSRLTAEQKVGEIMFARLGDSTFEARLMIDGERDRIMTLKGDEWQLDARIVTWKPPMTLLGLEPIYQLDRISGRYSDIERERTSERTVHALYEASAVDLWSLAEAFPRLLPGVDAYYGTATFLPMAPGARYEIHLSRDALIARPGNDAARAAVGAWDES